MPKRRGFLEKLSPKDPNYEIAKRFYHQAWADSHGLAAKAFAGQASFTDFVNGCVLTFEQGAATHVAIGDGSSASVRCTAIDDMLEKFTFQFNETMDKEAKRLGKLKARTIKRDFYQRVSEIAARSKQQIHEEALAEHLAPAPNPAEPAAISDVQIFRRWIEPIKVQLRRELISPETALEELRSIANDKETPVKLRWYISEQLDPLSPAAPPPEDSAADGLRAALKQPSENIRREAVAIILDRIMAPPEIRDYQAARRYSERIEAIRGGSARLSTEAPADEHAGNDFKAASEVPVTAPSPVTAATPKQIVDRCKLDHKIRSYEKVAARIGINRDTLFAITNETRWVSDHTYDLVAQFCKCKAMDLHPSGIPRRNSGTA